ncbi:MAG: hypothetical protein C0483_13955 [Pirellula sp.]|nr:hypothetical protein [Pirellula sp.]
MFSDENAHESKPGDEAFDSVGSGGREEEDEMGRKGPQGGQGDDRTKAKLTALLHERTQRLNELVDYNKRLDRTITLYLSAVYAAIGFVATKGLAADFEGVPEPVVFLFAFLNACILIHAVSQSCWIMAISKFVHHRIDPAILEVVGDPPFQRGTRLRDVGWLGWDDWRADVKGLANGNRGVVTLLWMILVVFISFYSFTLPKSPDFALWFWARWLFASLLVFLYGYAVYQFLVEGLLGVLCFHKLRTVQKQFLLSRRIVRRVALAYGKSATGYWNSLFAKVTDRTSVTRK